MKIILGSSNTPKKVAVLSAFQQAYLATDILIECVETNSGVSSHPQNASESIKGAINRITDARNQKPGADYYIGIEGGLLQVEGRAWEIGWIAIANSGGKIATGLSAGIEIKGEILKAILGGTELNDVLDNIYGSGKIGNTNGFYGLATGDLVTRKQAYEQGVHFALAQFKHDELFR